jgi:alanine dehydrogenase
MVLGGGIVGTQAARMAAGLGAQVTILDKNLDRLRYLSDVMPANVVTMFSNEYNIRKLVQTHDLIIGAVLIPGAKAPKLVTRDMVSTMRPGTGALFYLNCLSTLSKLLDTTICFQL